LGRAGSCDGTIRSRYPECVCGLGVSAAAARCHRRKTHGKRNGRDAARGLENPTRHVNAFELIGPGERTAKISVGAL
jgi:hypothetical protein